MRYRITTTIGDVNIRIDGHFVHVSTEQETCQDFSINLWDHATGSLGRQPTLDTSFEVATEALRELFPQFLALGILDFQAPLLDLMQSEVFLKFGSGAGARR